VRPRDNMFVFSSRRRHTRSKRDWSSDVCSSDLAAELGVEPESILKTIVLQGKGDPKDFFVVCLPIVHEMDLKLVAQQLGKKQVHLADNKNLIYINGYIHRANTPICIHAFKGFPIYFDERIKPFEIISVSAGKV